MTTNQTTWELVAEAIASADRPEKWVADQVGISYPTFRRRLRGGGEFTVGELGRIAKVLAIQPIDLLPAEFHEKDAA